METDADPFPHRQPAGYAERTNAGAFKACRRPHCGRVVKRGVIYCCAPCAQAAGGNYEIDEHSGGCDERAAGRSGGGAEPAPSRDTLR
jgi:hypothetical protein